MENNNGKVLSFVLKVRVYGKGLDTTNSHAYLIDDMPFSMSSIIGEINIDIRTTTINKLRSVLEYDTSNNMTKRNLLFHEALFIMSRLPNLYGRETDDLKKYQLGFIKKNNHSEIFFIKKESENSKIVDIIGLVDFFNFDLLIIPLSQISPLKNSCKLYLEINNF
jgi:hypothetical protein